MDKIVEIKEANKEERLAKREAKRAKRRENWEAFKEMQKNPAVVIAELTMLAATIGCAAEAMKTVQNVAGSVKSMNNKDTAIWDATNGVRIQTKGELTRDQLVEFDARRKSGESAAAILNSMDMIK